LAFAVDASLQTFEAAAECGAQLLIVHHGIFWKDVFRIVDIHYARLKTLFGNGIGLYAAHLPLDVHPILGNNAQLLEKLNFEPDGEFGFYHGVKIGRAGVPHQPVPRQEMLGKIEELLGGKCHLLPFGRGEISRIGICSGGAAEIISQAVEDGCDSFFTGETDHVSYHVARELGINVFFGGHYATETFGVRALQNHLMERYSLDGDFIDLPTGM
jgi:dinuclear metal center YbgI/SA1388 family protein